MENVIQFILRRDAAGVRFAVFPFLRAGRWWSKHEEIDLFAVNEEEIRIVFAEVK